MTTLLEKNNSVQEKSFTLGLWAESIPVELKAFSREYYNLGLGLFHAHKEMHHQSDLIRFLSDREDSFWEDQAPFKNFKSTVIYSAECLVKMDEQYMVYLSFKEEFKYKNPNLIKILDKKIMFDFSYDVCRNSYVTKILQKKRKV